MRHTHTQLMQLEWGGGDAQRKQKRNAVFSFPLCLQPFSKKAVDHVQSHLAKKQVPPSLFQVTAAAGAHARTPVTGLR